MKTAYLMFVSFLLLLQSCTIDRSGDVQFNLPMFILTVVFLALIIAYGAKIQHKKDASFTASLQHQGLENVELESMGAYVGGHPTMDDAIDNVLIYFKDRVLHICLRSDVDELIQCGDIPVDAIKNITVEDESSIEKKITLGRVLLVGVFALAWRKKKKNELAFVTIEWNDGRFDHDTLFKFEGKNAMQEANTKRNCLIRLCHKEDN